MKNMRSNQAIDKTNPKLAVHTTLRTKLGEKNSLVLCFLSMTSHFVPSLGNIGAQYP
jgi:hypothetical protein